MAIDPVVGWLIVAFLILLLATIVAQVGDSCKQARILDQFCAEVGGASLGGGKAEVRHRSWVITISMETETDTAYHDDGVGTSMATTTTREYTRVRASYFSTDDFHFSIYPKGCFSRLGVLLGMQDLNIGAPSFNRLFVVKGSDETRLQNLLRSPAIHESMQREPRLSLTRKSDNRWVFRKLPKGMGELHLEVDERIEDVDRLKSLTTLASELLDELTSLGSASERELESLSVRGEPQCGAPNRRQANGRLDRTSATVDPNCKF